MQKELNSILGGSMSIWLALLAVLPGFGLMYLVYKKDKIEDEPVKLLIHLVIFGAIAGVIAGTIEAILDSILVQEIDSDTIEYLAIEMFLIVGFAEEFCKYMVVKLNTWNNPEFDFEFDAIVYCVCAAGGFAIFENLFYVADGGLVTALLRTVTAIPGHIMMGIVMGIWYGRAKKYDRLEKRFVSKLCRFLAVLCPMILHGIYDFLASIPGAGYYFIAYIIVVYALAYISMDSKAYFDLPFMKSTAEKELDAIIHRLDANMSNNYKDNAQENLRELEAKYKEFYEYNKLSKKREIYYEKIILDRKDKLIGFAHKDQKPYWT